MSVKPEHAKRVAKVIYDNVRAMLPGRFTAEPASSRTHPHVDWKAYGAARKRLEELGFRHLTDVDVTSVYQDPSMFKRAVLSVFVGPDGTEGIGYYRLVLRWTLKGIFARFFAHWRDTYDVGTSFDDGDVILETTTAAATGIWDSPPFVLRKIFQPDTPLAALIDHHRHRVREYRVQHPEKEPRVVRTVAEAFEVSERSEQRKLEWRRSRGWVTREEIARITKTDGPVLDKIYQEFCGLAERG